jgi:hypothetical protein
MHGFQENIDWTLLVGKIVSLVCFAEFQANLLFDDEGGIQIEGSFVLVRAGSTVRAMGENVRDCGVLISLVGDSIASVTRRDVDRLALHFQSGAVLELVDEGSYESFHFQGKWCGEIHV